LLDSATDRFLWEPPEEFHPNEKNAFFYCRVVPGGGQWALRFLLGAAPLGTSMVETVLEL